MTELVDRTAADQARMFANREVSARELLGAHLARIDERNPIVNAVVALDPSHALERAAAQDEAVAKGERLGPLAGLVTAHKDLTETADFPTTYGSPIFAEHRPTSDSLLVARMKAAGVLAVGKTNTPEFGAGSHTHNPVYGITRNPWNLDRSAGGSSGGAAVGLATGMLAVADGSDAGGSLRNPAGWNNVVGFRSSSRVVPRRTANALLPYAIEGPMGRTVDDLLLLLEVLGQPDANDPLHRTVDFETVRSPLERPLRVAFSPSAGGLPVEPDVAAVLATVPDWLTSMGWSVAEAEPDFAGADECFETIRSWYYANDALLGALGDRLAQAKAVLGDEVERGRALDTTAVWNAHTHMTTLWRRGVDFFTDYDLLLAPVSQVSPFPVDWEYPTEVAGRPMDRYIEWMRSCSRITAFGLPTLSLPAGFTTEGLPVGVQVIGRPLGDTQLLQAARAMESARPQHQHRPPLA